MSELLTPLRTTTTASNDVSKRNYEPSERTALGIQHRIQSAEDVLKTLKSKPGYDLLMTALLWLAPGYQGKRGFDIYGQVQISAQITHTLISVTIPDYWSTTEAAQKVQKHTLRGLIVAYLSNVPGLAAITNHLRELIKWKEVDQGRRQAKEIEQARHLQELINLLESILQQPSFMSKIWSDIGSSHIVPEKRSYIWRELVNTLANGRILSLAAEAYQISSKRSSLISPPPWIADGAQFSAWIGRNLEYMIENSKDGDRDILKACVQILERALTLGHPDQVIQMTFGGFSRGSTYLLGKYRSFIDILSISARQTVLSSLLRVLLKSHLSSKDVNERNHHEGIDNVAAALASLSKNQISIESLLIRWLSSNGVMQDLAIRRAVVAALAENPESLRNVLKKELERFGDKLFIKHSPILQQEGTTENILVLAGHIRRTDLQFLANLSQSSSYLNAISNRLAAPSPRTSVLGMYVGTAVSQLVDPPDKQMNFSSEEMGSAEGRRYLKLISIRDSIGSMENLKLDQTVKDVSSTQKKNSNTHEVNAVKSTAKRPTQSKIISIEEVDDESESEDEDFPIYEKPDSDASDSDEDPTLINRSRPTAPVYITDLLSGLRDTENYDRHHLALKAASPLIRRKFAFGTEVTDHAEELASILVGLGDKWNMDNFQDLRLQAMIAVLIAQPLEMGQWYSKTYFNGDYSISQRASILTTLGMGARELAGYGKEDAALTGSDALPKNAFPSKQLPSKLHRIYALESTHVDAVSKNLEKTIIQPMALRAADALSGPDALKIRTFSSRIQVEASRSKPIPNALAKIVADGFFFPLTGRWRIHSQSHNPNSPLHRPPLLPLFLKTLALTLHAAGPSTLPLPLMTSELFSLLLSLRTRASDLPTLEALLFAFLTLLEVNGNPDGQRRLASENPKELLEMMGWVEGVFGKVRGGAEEEEKVRMCAAGCLGRAREVVEREERSMLGELAGFV